MLLEVTGGYIGVIAIGFLSLLISSISKKSGTSIIISVGMFLIYMIMEIFIRPQGKFMNLLVSLFPAGISQIFYNIFSYRFVNIAGFAVWLPYLMIPAGIFQILLYWYISIKMYRLYK